MITKKNIVLSDEQVNFLAECYIKLNKNKTYQNLSKAFKDYVDEFLDEQLLVIQRTRRNKDGRQD